MLTAQTLKIGARYNWRNQSERLVYVGLCEPRNGRWHQFEKIGEPGVVWCEVLDEDLHRLEETPIADLADFCAEGQRLGLTASDLAPALAKRPEFADCLATKPKRPTKAERKAAKRARTRGVGLDGGTDQ
jgi:hypothetical protein